jgi:hypothetical protein
MHACVEETSVEGRGAAVPTERSRVGMRGLPQGGSGTAPSVNMGS